MNIRQASFGSLVAMDNRLLSLKSIAITEGIILKRFGYTPLQVFTLRYLPTISYLVGPRSSAARIGNSLSTQMAFDVVCYEIMKALKGEF